MKVSISKAWDESRAVIARDGRVLSAIALALLVLPGLIADLFLPRLEPGELPDPGAWMIPLFLAFVCTLVGQLAIIHIAAGRGATAGQAISDAASRAPVYVGATLFWMLPFLLLVFFIGRVGDPNETPSPGVALFALIAALVLVIGGLFVFVRMLMAGPVAANESVGVTSVLSRSWALTRGNWWRLFGIFLLFMIAGITLLMSASIVAGIIGKVISGDPQPMTVGGLLISIVTQLVGAAVSVLFATMLARIYVQLAEGTQGGVSVPSSKDA